MNTALAAALSALVPGLGQLAKGQRSMGLTTLCMTLGIWAGIAVSVAGPQAFRSGITAGLLALVYLFVWFPSVADAASRRAAASKTFSGERAWYVIFMLLTVGPMALPLLWQSPRFSAGGKRGWTAFVLAVFFGGLYLTVALIPKLEEAMRQLGIAL